MEKSEPVTNNIQKLNVREKLARRVTSIGNETSQNKIVTQEGKGKRRKRTRRRLAQKRPPPLLWSPCTFCSAVGKAAHSATERVIADFTSGFGVWKSRCTNLTANAECSAANWNPAKYLYTTQRHIAHTVASPRVHVVSQLFNGCHVIKSVARQKPVNQSRPFV